MMSVSPIDSNSPAITSERPKARVAIATGLRKNFKSHEILRASRMPMTVPPSQTPKAFAATLPMPSQLTELPASAFPLAAMMPMPMARTIMPRTSSMTAPAMIVTPSSVSIFRRSERMRAVMPTDVAVDMIPMNIAAGERIA